MLSDKEINKLIVRALKDGATPEQVASMLRSSSKQNQRDFIRRVTKLAKR